MQIQTFTFNAFMENTYVLFDETKEGVLIDPGCYSTEEQEELINFVESEGIDLKLVLNTHGHIDHVYCRPSVAGTGLVSSLYDHLETHAVQLGLKKLYTEASEGARRFFLKKGFMDQGRIDFDIDGVPIHNYNMDKLI